MLQVGLLQLIGMETNQMLRPPYWDSEASRTTFQQLRAVSLAQSTEDDGERPAGVLLVSNDVMNLTERTVKSSMQLWFFGFPAVSRCGERCFPDALISFLLRVWVAISECFAANKGAKRSRSTHASFFPDCVSRRKWILLRAFSMAPGRRMEQVHIF